MERVKTTRNFFETAAFAFSKNNHIATKSLRLAQIRGGKWTVVPGYFK
jgi:hypothetical protein